ncbi:MAG: VanZ family protein [Microbacterium sp.]
MSERRARGIARWLVLVVALAYVVAVVVWTLLPGRSSEDADCAGVNLDLLSPFGSRGLFAPGDPLAEPAVLQFVVGVVLYLPVGVFVRVLWAHGVVVSAAAGLGLSLVMELTQLTGVWGLSPCAYRVFGLDDLLAGALGAALGSILSLALPRGWRIGGAVVTAPRPVTRWRRGLAMTCDWASVYLIGLALGAPVAAMLFVSGGRGAVEDARGALDAVSTCSALAITGAVALGTRRTIGDRILQLEYRGDALPPVAARVLRFVGGIGGYQILTAFTEGANPVSAAFVVVSIVLVFTTAKGRGLPGLASRQALADVRDQGATPPPAKTSASVDG